MIEKEKFSLDDQDRWSRQQMLYDSTLIYIQLYTQCSSEHTSTHLDYICLHSQAI